MLKIGGPSRLYGRLDCPEHAGAGPHPHHPRLVEFAHDRAPANVIALYGLALSNWPALKT